MAPSYGVKGINAVVTGGSGFVGQRLVEMLVEAGVNRVVSFDRAPKPKGALDDPRIVYMQGDITNQEHVDKACEGAQCIWHIAALVGPFHSADMYMAVNYQGSVNVLNAARRYKVGKLVMSSSPSTRFDGSDIDGKTEAQLSFPKKFLELYAASKAKGELAIREACCDELMTVAIAPHQVYGPRDPLFLPNLLEAHGKGQLRIFGNGLNRISFTYVDNYCHGLILGYDALYEGSPALGKFYIVTDGGYRTFWKVLDSAGVAMGFTSLWSKVKLPTALMMLVAYICVGLGFILGRKMKVNPFTVKMLTIHRWFDTSAAQADLKYQPLVTFEEGWQQTLAWFQKSWLPTTRFYKEG